MGRGGCEEDERKEEDERRMREVRKEERKDGRKGGRTEESKMHCTVPSNTSLPSILNTYNHLRRFADLLQHDCPALKKKWIVWIVI